ncbi:ABC transporter [Picosynechococcus sp. PCC 7003]|uniref:ABC transporter ATP-binding protein n=1 Tax=Picosynechococcus sp. PCC 7003 TaxID=374981 RepID=UPI0008109755|nr:ABC transporter ATP-binding protein [Picosynechococcus sp. PCC 7003]ANV85498.1 ABC transporter [Picosynechococcus sp. PCC 7003]
MSDTIIRVENLGKKYIIGHQAQSGGWKPNRGNYVALRDVVANGAKSFGKRLIGKERRRSYTTEEFWALKDINFEIKRGEVVGIIGRNGAGKSTLLKILSRITEPTTGRIELRGRVASLLEVGTGFHPELTGRENIYLNGSILGMSRLEIRKKFDEIVAFAEVERFLDTPVKRYSSGMYVRLAFAVAAHLEPEILVVDEVLAVGDAQFQKKCLGKMGDVAKQEGRTVLFVSHNMTAVKSLCIKGIWLDQGSLVGSDEISRLVSEYLAVGNTCNLEKKWENQDIAPGTHEVKLHYIKLMAQDESSEITIESPLILVVEFWNFCENSFLNLSLNLFDINEVHVFNSCSQARNFPQGLIQFTCHIPPNLLNDETYKIEVMIVKNMQIIFAYRDALVFEVIEQSREGDWLGKWSGIVRPKLKWKASLVEKV